MKIKLIVLSILLVSRSAFGLDIGFEVHRIDYEALAEYGLLVETVKRPALYDYYTTIEEVKSEQCQKVSFRIPVGSAKGGGSIISIHMTSGFGAFSFQIDEDYFALSRLSLECETYKDTTELYTIDLDKTVIGTVGPPVVPLELRKKNPDKNTPTTPE